MKRSPIKSSWTQRRVDFAAELNRQTPALFERSGGMCELGFAACMGRATHRHHRQRRDLYHPVESNRLSNLLHLCQACHEVVHSFPEQARARGWIVRLSNDPDEIDVEWFHAHEIDDSEDDVR